MPPERRSEGVPELLRRLSWPAMRRLGLHLGGMERSLIRGAGLEHAESREYVPGDDPRQIDWNLTARSDRPYVKDSFPERAMDAWLVIDESPSMAWGTARCLKGELATEMAVAASELLGRSGNRVGVCLFGGPRDVIVPPRSGRPHRLRLLAHLADAPGQGSGSHSGLTNLAAALERIERAARRPALIVLVTDFMAPDGWERVLARIGARHEVVAAHVSDPREAVIPDVGVVTLEDPETGRQLTVNTADRGLRERFAAAAAAQREGIAARLRWARVSILPLGTDEELVPALARFLAARKAASRAPAAVALGAAR